jgi:hypothetical protein
MELKKLSTVDNMKSVLMVFIVVLSLVGRLLHAVEVEIWSMSELGEAKYPEWIDRESPNVFNEQSKNSRMEKDIRIREGLRLFAKVEKLDVKGVNVDAVLKIMTEFTEGENGIKSAFPLSGHSGWFYVKYGSADIVLATMNNSSVVQVYYCLRISSGSEEKIVSLLKNLLIKEDKKVGDLLLEMRARADRSREKPPSK